MTYLRKDLIFYTACLEKIRQEEVGGKGWNLFLLHHSGFSVPPWFVVSSTVFKEALRAQEGEIDSILSNIDFRCQNAVYRASLCISELISQSECPKEFWREVFMAIDEVFERHGFLAVRSSVIGEDSTENSFAGQMDSFLNVRPSEVIQAIKGVWESAFSSRALLYRHQKKLPLTGISTAVIVQEMVQPATSGVVFTRDPQTNRKQCIISAGYGVGEGVVHNISETDTYRIGWHSDEIIKDVPSKNCRVVVDGIKGGTRTEIVPGEFKLRQVLTDPQIQHVRDIGVTVEQCFRTPQDIEWAYDLDGKLYVLQARPIVFVNPSMPDERFRIWDNSNIVESFPGLTLPLTFSIIRKGYESTFRNAALGFVPSKKVIEQMTYVFRNLIGILEGRVYYNLLNWYGMYSYLPGFKKHKDSFDQMIGISKKIDFPQAKLSPVDKFYGLVMTIWKLLRVKTLGRRFFTYFDAAYLRCKVIDVSALNEEGLIAFYDALEQDLLRKWHLTLENDFCAMKYYDWLKKLCSRWGLAGLENDLLCGEMRIESVAPVRSLVRLAEMFRSDPRYEALIRDEDDRGIWEQIQREPSYRPLKEALEVHLQEFGDRTREELKLEISTFREEPQSLFPLVRNYYKGGLSVAQMEEQEQQVRRTAEQRARQNLKNLLKRILFRIVLRNARLAIANRENMRFARGRTYGLLRRIFRRMGDLFAEKDVLETPADIFYLTADEVHGFVEGTAITQNLKCLTQLRRAEYAQFRQRALADRLETTGVPYLSPLAADVPGSGSGNYIKGTGCSSGIAEGTARVIFDPQSPLNSENTILISKSTDPGWVFLMIASRGIVVEKGSVLSHTAIIGRELGIPTVVGAKDVTTRIPNGATVAIDGRTGDIRWH